jgi:hypothetical protein
LVLLFLALGIVGRLAAADSQWTSTLWNGEKALVSVHDGWKAIVSLERGRLTHFGPADSGANLLFATATRDDPAGWGGHRLWLGPQSTWAKIWPPPDTWEHSGPESFTVENGTLRLVMPDAGDGWPRLTRTYRWNGRRLVCGAEIHGGTRPAQIIQIVQAPSANRITVLAKPDAAAPLGYVRLPAGQVSRLTTAFDPPPHVTREKDTLTLRYLGVTEKLGFRPQGLVGASSASLGLKIGRVSQTGVVAGEPDQGFSTQVYLGGHEPFIELEQLTPLFSPRQTANFEISIEGEKPPAKQARLQEKSLPVKHSNNGKISRGLCGKVEPGLWTGCFLRRIGKPVQGPGSTSPVYSSAFGCFAGNSFRISFNRSQPVGSRALPRLNPG